MAVFENLSNKIVAKHEAPTLRTKQNLHRLAPHAHGPRYATSLTRPTRTSQRGGRQAKQKGTDNKTRPRQNEDKPDKRRGRKKHY